MEKLVPRYEKPSFITTSSQTAMEFYFLCLVALIIQESRRKDYGLGGASYGDGLVNIYKLLYFIF